MNDGDDDDDEDGEDGDDDEDGETYVKENHDDEDDEGKQIIIYNAIVGLYCIIALSLYTLCRQNTACSPPSAGYNRLTSSTANGKIDCELTQCHRQTKLRQGRLG